MHHVSTAVGYSSRTITMEELLPLPLAITTCYFLYALGYRKPMHSVSDGKKAQSSSAPWKWTGGSGRVDSTACITMEELFPLSLDIDMLLLIFPAGRGRAMVTVRVEFSCYDQGQP